MALLPVRAEEPGYPVDVTKWEEVTIPPERKSGERYLWFYRANRSPHMCRVFTKGGEVHGKIGEEEVRVEGELPGFKPKEGKFHRVGASAKVEDGWLVGFDHGEFGAELCWFSPEGERHYKIEASHVVSFFSLPGGLYAIEGLAHLGPGFGSVMRIFKPEPEGRWQTEDVASLPAAPRAVVVDGDGALVVVLANSAVRVGKGGEVSMLFADAPWWGLYPQSAALSADGRKLYIGMRQFVGELDLPTKKLRMLVPSERFLNKLPEADERRIRETYR